MVDNFVHTLIERKLRSLSTPRAKKSRQVPKVLASISIWIISSRPGGSSGSKDMIWWFWCMFIGHSSSNIHRRERRNGTPYKKLEHWIERDGHFQPYHLRRIPTRYLYLHLYFLQSQSVWCFNKLSENQNLEDYYGDHWSDQFSGLSWNKNRNRRDR